MKSAEEYAALAEAEIGSHNTWAQVYATLAVAAAIKANAPAKSLSHWGIFG